MYKIRCGPGAGTEPEEPTPETGESEDRADARRFELLQALDELAPDELP